MEKKIIIIILSILFLAFTENEKKLLKKYYTEEELNKLEILCKNILELKKYKNKIDNTIDTTEKEEMYRIFEKKYKKYKSEIEYFEKRKYELSIENNKKDEEWSKYYFPLVNNPTTPENVKKKLEKENIIRLKEYNKTVDELSKLSDIIFKYTYAQLGGQSIEGKWKNNYLVFESDSWQSKNSLFENRIKNRKQLFKTMPTKLKYFFQYIILSFLYNFIIFHLLFGGIIYLFFIKKQKNFKKIIFVFLTKNLVVFIAYFFITFLLITYLSISKLTKNYVYVISACNQILYLIFVFLVIYNIYKSFKKYSQ